MRVLLCVLLLPTAILIVSTHSFLSCIHFLWLAVCVCMWSPFSSLSVYLPSCAPCFASSGLCVVKQVQPMQSSEYIYLKIQLSWLSTHSGNPCVINRATSAFAWKGRHFLSQNFDNVSWNTFQEYSTIIKTQENSVDYNRVLLLFSVIYNLDGD